jgi:hypothetical protein
MIWLEGAWSDEEKEMLDQACLVLSRRKLMMKPPIMKQAARKWRHWDSP